MITIIINYSNNYKNNNLTCKLYSFITNFIRNKLMSYLHCEHSKHNYTVMH